MRTRTEPADRAKRRDGRTTAPPVATRPRRNLVYATIGALIALAVMMLPAAGADVTGPATITFDDLPGDGSVVLTDQYLVHDGVTFGATPPNVTNLSPAATIATAPAGYASSGGQVAIINSGGCGGGVDFCPASIFMRFHNPQSTVGFFLGTAAQPCGGNGTTVTVTPYDPNGTALKPQDVDLPAGTSGVHKPVSVNVRAPISWLQIHSDSPCVLAIDDLSLDNSSSLPDFGITRTDPFVGIGTVGGATGGDVGLSVGGSTTVHLHISRFGGSHGAIHLSATTQDGVTVTFSPETVTPVAGTSSDSDVTATLTAPSSSGGKVGPVTITATPADGEQGPHTLTLSYTIVSTYDLRADALEITQGSQTNDFPLGPLSTTLPTTAAYSGTPLVAYKPTIVRFYASLSAGPDAGVVATAQLYELDSTGRSVCSVTPTTSPPVLTPTAGQSLYDERRDPAAGFTFVLPEQCTADRGAITLRALLLGPNDAPGLSLDPAIAECQSEKCQGNNSFVVTGVHFSNSVPFNLFPLAMVYTSGQLWQPDPDTAKVFGAALAAMPLGGRTQVFPYQGTIDFTSCLDPDIDKTNTCALNMVRDFTSDNFNSGEDANGVHVDTVVGVDTSPLPGKVNAPARGLSAPFHNGGFLSGDHSIDPTIDNGRQRWIGVVDQNRPLTSVAHELGHIFGLEHADHARVTPAAIANGVVTPQIEVDGVGGSGCGGDRPSTVPSWPDSVGGLEGVGLDTFAFLNGVAPANAAGVPVTQAPLLANGGPGAPIQSFDLMSYCARESNAWLSPINWQIVRDNYLAPASSNARVRRNRVSAVPSPSSGAPSIDVQGAWTLKDGVTIDSVRPTLSGERPPSTSDYHLELLDHSGRVLSDTPMGFDARHVDNGGGPVVLLEADVPEPAATTEAAITEQGVIKARRFRGAPPTVSSVAAPSEGSGGVAIRWTSTPAAGNPRTRDWSATVAYSIDGGTTWRDVWLGPDAGHATVAAFLLGHSDHAQLRVTVSDGFDAVTAVGEPFTSKGAPPAVTIIGPGQNATIPSDAVLSLDGEAYDDGMRPLTGASLTWLGSDGKVIGAGTNITVTALPPGLNQITLVATDARGVKGQALVRVNVVPVAPTLLTFKGPTSIAPTVQKVRFQLVASESATLTVGSSTFTGARSSTPGPAPTSVAVGRKSQVVTVSVTPGSTTLVLSLRLTASGKTSTYSTRIAR